MKCLLETLQFPGVKLMRGAWGKLFVLVLIPSTKNLSFLFGLKSVKILLILRNGLCVLGDIEDFIFNLCLLRSESHWVFVIFIKSQLILYALMLGINIKIIFLVVQYKNYHIFDMT